MTNYIIHYTDEGDYFLNGVMMGKNLKIEEFLRSLKRDLEDDRMKANRKGLQGRGIRLWKVNQIGIINQTMW